MKFCFFRTRRGRTDRKSTQRVHFSVASAQVTDDLSGAPPALLDGAPSARRPESEADVESEVGVESEAGVGSEAGCGSEEIAEAGA